MSNLKPKPNLFLKEEILKLMGIAGIMASISLLELPLQKNETTSRNNYDPILNNFWNNPLTQETNIKCHQIWKQLEISDRLHIDKNFDRKMTVVEICKSILKFITIGMKKKDLEEIEAAISIVAFYGGIDPPSDSKLHNLEKQNVIAANYVILMKFLEKRHLVFGKIFKQWASEDTKRIALQRRNLFPNLSREIILLSLQDTSCGLQLIRGPLNTIYRLYSELRKTNTKEEFFIPGSDLYNIRLLFNSTVRLFREICPPEQLKIILDTVFDIPQAELLYSSSLSFDNGNQFINTFPKFLKDSKKYDKLFNDSFIN